MVGQCGPENTKSRPPKVVRQARRAPFERSKNVVQMLESSDKLHTKSEE